MGVKKITRLTSADLLVSCFSLWVIIFDSVAMSDDEADGSDIGVEIGEGKVGNSVASYSTGVSGVWDMIVEAGEGGDDDVDIPASGIVTDIAV